MTIGKAVGLTAGFVAAFALGVAIGPSVKQALPEGDRVTHVAQPAAAPVEQPTAPATRARATAPRPKSNTAASKTSEANASIAASEPRLHDRLKPVLNPGARMSVAADGFRSAEEFATVAHAARNTSVPFMVLKHRVLNERRSLADAIHEAKPEIDAKAEVKRAQAAAKSDLEALAG
jgi:hypothetical protein